VRRTPRLAIVSAVLSAVLLAGCGGEESKPVDLSKGTDTSKFGGMMEQMNKNIKADKTGKPLTR
jgi:hypothetical protein